MSPAGVFTRSRAHRTDSDDDRARPRAGFRGLRVPARRGTSTVHSLERRLVRRRLVSVEPVPTEIDRFDGGLHGVGGLARAEGAREGGRHRREPARRRSPRVRGSRRIAVRSSSSFVPAPTIKTFPAVNRSPSRRVTSRSSPFFPASAPPRTRRPARPLSSPGPGSPSVNAGHDQEVGGDLPGRFGRRAEPGHGSPPRGPRVTAYVPAAVAGSLVATGDHERRSVPWGGMKPRIRDRPHLLR